MVEADRKREVILEKAILRFSHFGIQKTTMNEIADDLSMSKPSMYYYFPDKSALILAVVERIIAEYQERLALLFEDVQDIKDALFSMLELRREFLQKYFMLHLTDQTELNLLKEEIRLSINHIRTNEILLFKEVFEKGIEKGQIRQLDAEHTAALFIDMLSGISYCIAARQEKRLLPDPGFFDEVLLKQKELSEIFLNGLK